MKTHSKKIVNIIIIMVIMFLAFLIFNQYILKGIYRKKEIMKVFPKRYLTGIDLELFEKMQKEVLIPLWERQEELAADGLNVFGVELNVVENNRLVPFEIEAPENFKVIGKDFSELYKAKSKEFSETEQEKKRIMLYGKAK